MTEKILSIHRLDDLAEAQILAKTTPELEKVARQFSLAITPAMILLIDRNDSCDPIAAQFVPSEKELNVRPEERVDPIGDEAHSPIAGIVHRYPDRVLLKLTHICAVYCRFCFRREMIGPDAKALSPQALNEALDYIATHKEIWEVILTGGDPLILSDRRLADVIGQLNSIKHVKVLRIHTRMPVVDPERITPEFITALRGRAPVYILLHCNHTRELTDAARAACARLVDAGIVLLSQSVLLRGVNDDPESLGNLMRALIECRVKPHYLHQLDFARGTSHFRVPLAEAQELVRGMRGHLSGLCQPTLMLDIPGGAGKIPVGPVFAHENDDEWIVEDYLGQSHAYGEVS